jgi:hypothetical protein
MYKLRWHPGQENLADYPSKHHAMSHHIKVRPWYLHMEISPRFLPRAQKPSALKGCVGTLDDGYVCNVPLPRAPRIQSASHMTCYQAVMRDGSTPFHSTPLVYESVAPRIQSTGHVTCYGAVTHDESTPLHSTPLAYEPTYVRSTPRIQSGGHVTSHRPVTRDDVPEPDTCYLQIPLVPTWSDLIRSLTGLGRFPRIIPFSPV